MASRRSTALRPPQPAQTNMNGFGVEAGNGGGNSNRPKTLKRTISKCGIDASSSGCDSSNTIAPKKLAPLHEPSAPSQQRYRVSPRHEPTELYHHHHQPQQFHEKPANDVYFDHGEPVLLPRYLPQFAPQCDDGDLMDDEEEVFGNGHPSPLDNSPVAPYGWDGTPQGANNRYYESILESTSSLVSPSPQHIMYPYTPVGGYDGTRSSSSTVSFDSSPMYTPYDLAMNNNSSTPVGVGSGGALGHVRSHQVLHDREYLSAANLHAVMINYLEEIFQYYELAKSFTFEKVAEMVQSVPFAFRYIQGLVKNRLGISWHLVGSFVENILGFLCDEDLREANVKEFADFLRSIQERLYENMPAGNIFLNLFEFFQNVLAKFKKYLIQHWISIQRIQFPCEFGKKSETLFLCMECHREHL